MTRGRKQHADPPINVTVSIPESLNAKVELLLYDPVLRKPRYGGRSALIQSLLRKWIAEQQKEVLTKPLESDRLNALPIS